MGEFSLERFALEDANVFCARLKGPYRFEESLENAKKLAERLTREARAAVILDYTEAVLAHTLEQFASVGDVFIEHAPKTCRFAYVFGDGNVMHAAAMTKRLKRAGFEAAAFPDWEQAEAYARDGAAAA